MNHLPNLITDLALILGTAGITTLVFKWLKQPVVLGYIIAGFFVSPQFSLLPTVTDINDIKIWADIGVIFLLFALGLEFSFRKLVKVGGTAAVTGIFEISLMAVTGYSIGRVMNWSTMDSLFLGGMIAISSTTIIFRAFDELRVKAQQFAGLVIGVLVIEDLMAVLLMVLLSTIALSKEYAGVEMLMALGKLLLFLGTWFLMGIFLLPSFFKRTAKWLNKETLLIVALALCLGMVVLTTKLDFSPALGAFMMGSILAETTQAERIEKIVLPIKNLFGAIFFVSVGMLINPALLLQYAIPVLILTLTVIIGKLLFVTLGALISGQPLKQSIQAGSSMVQIGEFSFIIATMGVGLKVISNYLYPVAVGVSVITTFFTPYMMRLSNPLYHFIDKILPERWKQKLNNYSLNTQSIQAKNEWKQLIYAYLQTMVVHTLILVALILLSTKVLAPVIEQYIANENLSKIVNVIITLTLMSPFLWGLMMKKIDNSAYKELWLDKKYNKGVLVMMEVMRNLLGILFVGFLLIKLFSTATAIIIWSVAILAILLIFRRRLQKFYHRIENRFLQNLREKELLERQKEHLSPWDAHLTDIEINPNVDFIGKNLEELAWREQYGINVAFIERGNKIIYAPNRYEKIYPYDIIGIIATDKQLQQIRPVIEKNNEDFFEDKNKTNIVLEKIIVDEHTKLKGQSIRSSGIREKTNGLVVGIERNDERIINPESDTVFEWEDIVWIVGDKKKIKQLNIE